MAFPERGLGAVHVFLYEFVIFFGVEVLGIFVVCSFFGRVKLALCELQAF